MTMRRAKRCQNSAALLILMRRTVPALSTEPIEPAYPLRLQSMERHATEANPEPTINQFI